MRVTVNPMSRPSAKRTIVEAALEQAVQAGIASLTYESVAAAAGMTKGGVLYHFPSREDLVRDVVAHFMDRWHDEALRHLGKPFDQASRTERVLAFVLSSMEPDAEVAGGGDLGVVVDVARDPHYGPMWVELRERWVGDVATLTRRQQLALAAADGIWLDEMMQVQPYPAEHRAEIVAEIVRMVRADQAPPEGGSQPSPSSTVSGSKAVPAG